MQQTTLGFVAVAALFLHWSGRLGHQFDVVRRLPSGERVRESYMRSDDGRYLTLILKREGAGRSPLHRVYEVRRSA